MPRFTAAEIARHLNAAVIGNPEVVLTSVAPAELAQAGDLTFAENPRFLAKAEASAASAVLTAAAGTASAKTLIVVANPRAACARVLPLFFPESPLSPGIHPSAVVHPTASVEATVHLGPLCVVGARVRLAAGCVVEGGTVMGEDCVLDENTRLFPNVTLYPGTRVGRRVRIHAGAVIGSDGFGYAFENGVHLKIPQVGHVIVEDDVEIGANVTIDRGALGATVIGRGSKLDNLVQVAHNVTVGEHCLLVAQVGIAGSTQVGNYVVIAGQAGIADHLKIGHRVAIGAQAGVMTDIPDGQKWVGAPARPALQAKRQVVAIEKLPELLRRLAELEREVAALKARPATA